ncbi:MAG TPA: alkaline phosphatase family protein [Acidimicrobiales bacterium]|nr:MAG: hypothetical protein B7X07_01940 [Actinobacteria bacterium 21-64-8]HQT99323.1 alkaline phosphatase family protein [Acidimicrobiales bacterium]
MRKLQSALVAMVVVLGAMTTFSASSHASTNTPACGVAGAPPHYRHVVWIVLENVGYQVVGSTQAPFLNGVARACGLATNDHAVAHPSLPNYLALVAGSTLGVRDDNEPSQHHLRAPSLFTQLRGNWRAYAESMPTSCDTVTSGTYAARHNPAVYFTNLRASCARRDVAMPAHLTLSAAFTFIAPNVCDDMHSCSIATGDAWLARVVPAIEASPEYRAHTLALFITMDESDSSASNQVPTYVIAPSVPRGRRVATYFTHYSLLATTEQLLGVTRLAHARGATTFIAGFHL